MSDASSRAAMLLAEGRWEEAQAAFEQILAASPADVVALYRIASCQARLGQSVQAMECLECAIQAFPGYAEAVEDLGFLALNLQQFERAEATFRRGLQLAPLRGRLQYGLGVALGMRGAHAEALSALRLAVALDPMNAEIREAFAHAEGRRAADGTS